MELPAKVLEALNELRKRHSHYVDIKIINGRCYVYESTSSWDKERKKVKKTARYLGKITLDGIFVPSVPRQRGLEAALVEGRPDGSGEQRRIYRKSVERVGKYEQEILMMLSMDGRATVSEIAKKIGLKNTATEWHRRNIEEKYGIRYIAEIDIGKLGYLTYIILIKFENKRPGINEARRELEKEVSVQLAMMTYGKFDIIMYMVMSRYDDIKSHLFKMRGRIFQDFDLKLYVVPFYLDYSFVPLREEFIDTLEERVWSRSADRPRPREGDLLRREYAVLRALGKDGRREFTSIDSEYGLTAGSARHTYHSMMGDGTIKRITISMSKVHINYISAISIEKINHVKFAEDRQYLMRSIAEDMDGSVMNKYALVGDIKMPEGVFILMPVANNEDMIAVDEQLKEIGGTEIDTQIITNVIVGSLCYRKFDNSESSQYKILKTEYENEM
jgi:Lrp/AsnC family transcriptional regulator for asnA, asnC and gidA